MALVGQMIDDLELRFTGGKPSDDFEIPKEQMRFWVDNANAALLPVWIKNKNGGQVPAAIVRRIDCLTVNSDTPTCVCECNSYTYIQFPANPDGYPIVPITLPDDKGVVLVKQGAKEIYRLPAVTMLSVMTNLKGGSETPYFYRIADKIYLFNGIYPSFGKLTVFAAISDTSSLKDTDVYPTVEELIPMILDLAEKTGRAEIEGVQDTQDDGRDETRNK